MVVEETDPREVPGTAHFKWDFPGVSGKSHGKSLGKSQAFPFLEFFSICIPKYTPGGWDKVIRKCCNDLHDYPLEAEQNFHIYDLTLFRLTEDICGKLENVRGILFVFRYNGKYLSQGMASVRGQNGLRLDTRWMDRIWDSKLDKPRPGTTTVSILNAMILVLGETFEKAYVLRMSAEL
ncbi:hypothetical protein K435DRAFT_809449 [Dendrothele bispora CBS 962.96]|uniref:Uncharacterized protein n=1 Tax=Dendrothele bispora (strain CBS 962.96) TaxID=1314807 RepID=A0A4S8KZC5_DENBC|nr:hypothetical protein K435DRAFT_809449 [Dendrothele bispora CBS 962.96]